MKRPNIISASDVTDVVVVSVVGCDVSGVARVLAGGGASVVAAEVGDREGFCELDGLVGAVARNVWSHGFAVEGPGEEPFFVPVWVERVYGERFGRVVERARVRALGEPLTFFFPGPPSLVPLLAERLDRPSVVVVGERPEDVAQRLLRAELISPVHAVALWEQQTRQMLGLLGRLGGSVWHRHPAYDPWGDPVPDGGTTGEQLRRAAVRLLNGRDVELLQAVEDGAPEQVGGEGTDPDRWPLVALDQQTYRTRLVQDEERAAQVRKAEQTLQDRVKQLSGERDRLKKSSAALESETRRLTRIANRRIVRLGLRLTRVLRPILRPILRRGRPDPPAGPQATTHTATSLMGLRRWHEAIDEWERVPRTGEDITWANAGLAFCRYAVTTGGETTSPRASVRSTQSETAQVVYTAIAGAYDHLWPIPWAHPGFRHVALVDRPATTFGCWEIEPHRYLASDERRTARWAKLHPHLLFPNARYVVWTDGNVVPASSWDSLLEGFQASGAPIGMIPHPFRTTVEEEIAACKQRKKDSDALLDEQLSRLGPDPEVGLFETNFMMFDLADDRLQGLLARWWALIEAGSTRDQIALPYALRETGIEPYELFEHGQSVRSDERFAYVPHGEAWRRVHRALTVAAASPVESPRERTDMRWVDEGPVRLEAQTRTTVDVIIPVHDAPELTQRCIRSVLATRDRARHRLILVDDGSSEETREMLERFVSFGDQIELIRHRSARGFASAANAALRRSEADMAIVLNSDTEVTGRWLDKLADAMFRPVDVGIVGPMSNAASLQSWPDHEPTLAQQARGQTVINSLPAGMSLEDVDRLLEGCAPADPVLTALVHGFCFAIRREVLAEVGLFDEIFFPEGFGEEVDYCLRAADAGWQLAWATNTFVWHEKSRSYAVGRRHALTNRGTQKIRERHGEQRRSSAIAAGQRTRQSLTHLHHASEAIAARSSLKTPVAGEVSSARRPRIGVLIRGGSKPGQWAGSGHVRAGRFVLHDDIRSGVDLTTGPVYPKEVDAVSIVRDAFLDLDPEHLEDLLTSERPVTIDLDDPLHDEDLLANQPGHAMSAAAVRAVLDRASRVTVSTAPLGEHIRRSWNLPVSVVPNLLDETLWFGRAPSGASPAPDDECFRLLYAGTWTHAEDLEILHEAIPVLRKRLGRRVEVEVFGGGRSLDEEVFTPVNIRSGHYPDYVRQLRQHSARYHLAVAPLVDNPFNAFKSDLKFLEYSALGLATVASRSGEYPTTVRSGEVGILADMSTSSWVEALEFMLLNPQRRLEMAVAARRMVRDTRTIGARGNVWVAAHTNT